MDKSLLEAAALEIKTAIYNCVTTRSYNGNTYGDGLQAKTALIRSSTVIHKIHESTKVGLHQELNRRGMAHEVHPPLEQSRPELDVWGLLKKKRQDVVVLMNDSPAQPEQITEGPMTGQVDKLGREATKRAIVVGVRSQLSSINKNYDTLIERALAETMNLRLRHPEVVMGEVFLVAVREYDEQAMKKNQVA